MKIIPYIIPPGIKIRRYQTNTVEGKVFGAGDTVYIIKADTLISHIAFSTHFKAYSFLRALNGDIKSFRNEIPRRAI